MYHKHCTYFRIGKVIHKVLPVNDVTKEEFKSISAAKRRSREIQLSNGRLGDGFLRVSRS